LFNAFVFFGLLCCRSDRNAVFITGWLQQKKGSGQWKKKFFVLVKGHLAYWEEEQVWFV
jgi:hypothetical protein